MTAESVTDQATYRTTFRRVEFQIELTGKPVIYQRSDDAYRIAVESVTLYFDRADDGSCVTAWLKGPRILRNGKPGKVVDVIPTGYAFELWPEWLQGLADEHRPERYVGHRGPLDLLAGSRSNSAQ